MVNEMAIEINNKIVAYEVLSDEAEDTAVAEKESVVTPKKN